MGGPRVPIPEHPLHPPAPAPAASGSVHGIRGVPRAQGPAGTPAPLAGGECRQPLLAGLGGRGVIQDALELQLQVPGLQQLPPVVQPDLVEAALVVDGQVLALHQVQQRVWGGGWTDTGVTSSPTAPGPHPGQGAPHPCVPVSLPGMRVVLNIRSDW